MLALSFSCGKKSLSEQDFQHYYIMLQLTKATSNVMSMMSRGNERDVESNVEDHRNDVGVEGL